jgi:hypothetical protein
VATYVAVFVSLDDDRKLDRLRLLRRLLHVAIIPISGRKATEQKLWEGASAEVHVDSFCHKPLGKFFEATARPRDRKRHAGRLQLGEYLQRRNVRKSRFLLAYGVLPKFLGGRDHGRVVLGLHGGVDGIGRRDDVAAAGSRLANAFLDRGLDFFL